LIWKNPNISIQKLSFHSSGHDLTTMMRASSVCALIIWGIVILGCSSVAEQGAPESTERFYESLARHYAPVIHQGAVSEQDYITALDFDGDRIGNNNWENMPYFELRANVYYTVIESKTHWFLFYSLFHPRDYSYEDCATSGGCHENDLESIQLAVEKDSTPFGRLRVLETLAHQSIYLYTLDDTVGGNFLKITGKVELEEDHPVVYVESLGRGIYGHNKASSLIHLYLGGVVTYPGSVSRLRCRKAPRTKMSCMSWFPSTRLSGSTEKRWVTGSHSISPSNIGGVCYRSPSMGRILVWIVQIHHGDTIRPQGAFFLEAIGL